MRLVNIVKAAGLIGAAKICCAGKPKPVSKLLVLLSGLSLALATAAQPAFADSFTGYIYNNAYAEQTSNSAPAAADQFFGFNIGAYFDNAGDYNSASATYPGPNSQSLPPAGPTQFDAPSPSTYSTQSALHTDYPFGTYTVTGTGGSQPTATSVIPYSSDHFATVVPYVTNFNSLSAFNTATDFTVTFNSFTKDAGVDQAFTFLTIYDANTNAVVFDAGFLDPSSMAVLIPGGTLLPGTSYLFDLDFSNRLNGFDAANSTDTHNSFTLQGFDVNTYGFFDTAAATPLPATWILMLSGLSGLAAIRRRKKNTAAIAAH